MTPSRLSDQIEIQSQAPALVNRNPDLTDYERAIICEALAGNEANTDILADMRKHEARLVQALQAYAKEKNWQNATMGVASSKIHDDQENVATSAFSECEGA